MKFTLLHKLVILMLIIGVTACTKQNWYQGARSAQTANCMNEPLSEYEDCNQQSDKNYDEYSKKREELIKETK